MKFMNRRGPLTAATGLLTTSLILSSLGTAVRANDEYASDSIEGSPIQAALAILPDDVRAYNNHITFLTDPFCAGRLPGTRGMEIAKEYIEFYFDEAGLEPAFAEAGVGGPEKARTPWRQAFPLGKTIEVTAEAMSYRVGNQSTDLTPGKDFKIMSLGSSGSINSEIVFVGYSMAEGPDGYSNYNENTDLTGKIALMFRFEPMDEDGNSRWSDGRWTARAGFQDKIDTAIKFGAVGVIIINTPGANDPRIDTVASAVGGRASFNLPVGLLSTEAAGELVKAGDPEGRSLMALRHYADEGGQAFAFNSNVKVNLESTIESKQTLAENVGGILPGRGNLADEYIVIGGHLDHLGMGDFGSRRGAGNLHPGADDNASGTAGILLIADKMVQAYAEKPVDANLRSILFLAFSGEESGLNGSRYYTRNPIVPLEQHVLMMNFDMIGRILNKRLSISGTTTGIGMADFLQPILDDSELEIVQPTALSGASDHTPFYQAKIPVLFAIIADFHADYHTPDDEGWKINRVDAVKACNLWTKIALACAEVPEFFAYQQAGTSIRPRATERSTRGQIKVRFGIVPGNYGQPTDDDIPGVLVSAVTPDSSAENGGVKAGDRLIKWNDQTIDDIGAWMGMLAKHEPDDIVEVTVLRDDLEVVLQIKLQGRDGG